MACALPLAAQPLKLPLSPRRRADSRHLNVRLVGHRTQKLRLIMDLLHEPELIRIDHVDHSTPPPAATQASRSENHERDRSLLDSPPPAATGLEPWLSRLMPTR